MSAEKFKRDEMDTRLLDGLAAAIKSSKAYGRIGILGEKSLRSGHGTELKGAGTKKLVANSPGAKLKSGDFENVTNASIGAAHEFGTSKLPQRSFLRVPIADKLPKEMVDAGLLERNTVMEVIKTKTVVPWLKKVMILCEGIVADAFDSGGFGKWKPSNMNNKKNKQTLVETQQLRNSITSDVKEGK